MSTKHWVAIPLLLGVLGLGFNFLTNVRKPEPDEPSRIEKASDAEGRSGEIAKLSELKSTYARLKAQHDMKKTAVQAVDDLYEEAIAYGANAEETDRRRAELLNGKVVGSDGQVALSDSERAALEQVRHDEEIQQKNFLGSYQDFKRRLK
jgi:hypothetical protein